jgi:nicotinate-nucleotide adenylyltransferase
MFPFLDSNPLPERVGILGGSFDPPHFGHLLVAENAREQCGLEQVLWLPAGTPPHKLDQTVTAAEHRYAMTQLACAESPSFVVARLELDRPGPSYTIETIRRLRELGSRRTRLYFIIGMDSALEFHTWREPQAILEEAQVVVAPRPGYSRDEESDHLPDGMHLLEMRSWPLSSTEIRERVAAGGSIRFLVPDDVRSYIAKYGLYQADTL